MAEPSPAHRHPLAHRPQLLRLHPPLSHRLTATSWPTTIDDHQAREFAQTLYHELARGQPLGAALDSTTIALTRWPDLPRPHLTGDRRIRFL